MYIKYIKPAFDIIICMIGLPVFILLYLIFGCLIKTEDKGPIFYKADRIGKRSQLFEMYKFRSMKINAPNWLNEDGSSFNAKDDPRVTKIGRLIRAASIDETPQIINVLKGEMSIIGPRACLAEDLGTFQSDEIDKMNVKPGITGFTQAYYRNSISSREKRLKDAWYANNVNFWLDVKIFFKTISTVFKREGLYTNDSFMSYSNLEISATLEENDVRE